MPGLMATPDSIAVTAVREDGADEIELTFKELESEVARWAHALRQQGIGVGDRVACTKSRPANPTSC